ncbi:EAL domain-containing protein [Marinilactibacillus kalidii]|uniref:EAL domain-containing protein n=1 Tax=Marinilactibacillus kalidii TaxID=2820274 RepID=UPI001ABDE460|nr:EAL domain-containing protein [Marinilactibacillus kalidii]
MVCKNCSTFGQRITFKLTDSLITLIDEHFHRNNHDYEIKQSTIITSESGAIDLYDFLSEMRLTEGIEFRINQLDWNPIEDFHDYTEASWIDQVINEKNLHMHFQPIIMSDGTIYGYELLARFKNDAGEPIYPNEIFPAAKVRGRTFALDRICRINAVKQIDRLEEHLKAFINFIPTAIYSPEHCLRTTTLIAKRLEVDPRRIIFEVVETEKIADMNHLKTILNYYQKNGFQYALDDVGSGYNTLDVFEELSPPYMKLDMAFVQGVSTDLKKQFVALAFLEKADKLGSIPLAEGIESDEDFQWLKEKGYQLFQGYLFGKPEPEPLLTNKIQLA